MFDYAKAISTIKKKEHDKKQFGISLKEKERENMIATFASKLDVEKQKMQKAIVDKKLEYTTKEELNKQHPGHSICGIRFGRIIGNEVKVILNELKKKEPDISPFIFIEKYLYWQINDVDGTLAFFSTGMINAFKFHWRSLQDRDINGRFFAYAVVFFYDLSE